MKIEEFVRPDLADLKPYLVKDIPHKIKMDANENPYEMPVQIRQLITEEIYKHHFNRYPDPVARKLRESLASEFSLNADQLLIGNGSDELINYIIAAFGGHGANVIFPAPTFTMYGILSDLWGSKTNEVPLSDSFELETDKILSRIKSRGRNIVFISYPNNPTGNCFSHQSIMEIINCGALVVLDEAYYEFSGKTFLPLLNDHENLIILRTFSKAYGLAGLRVGYMIAGSKIINEIMKVKLVYNINSLSQKIAMILLKHKEEMSVYIKRILQERDRLADRLNYLDGINPFPADANFILFRAEPDSGVIFSKLLENGILIRNLSEPGLLKNCLRVSVGKPEENDAFLAVMGM